MSAGEWLGAVVAVIVILTALGHNMRLLYRALRTWDGLPAAVKQLQTDVDGLKSTLNNGIRTDVAAARRLAGEAAATAARAEQEAQDARRGVNALRADVDAMTNVAMSDHADIWTTLREAGLDRRRDDSDDS